MGVNVEAYTAAVKALGRRLPRDPDLVQDAALFAWEHREECRGDFRPWIFAIAFQLRRAQRLALAREIDGREQYAQARRVIAGVEDLTATGVDMRTDHQDNAPRKHQAAHAATSRPEQEQAVLLREIAMLPDAAPIFREVAEDTAATRQARLRARRRVARMLEAA